MDKLNKQDSQPHHQPTEIATPLNRRQIRKRERIAAGLCFVCGKEPPKPNAKSCQSCLDKNLKSRDLIKTKNSKLILKQQRKANGLCVYCGINKHDPGKSGCKNCLLYRIKYSRENHKKRINNKICTRCGVDVKYQRYKICQDCRRKELNTKRKSYIVSGLCKTCGKYPIKNEDSTLCLRCTNRLRENKQRRNAERWQIILDHYGQKCACCGETGKYFLTIDHVNNDGALHKRIIGSKDTNTIRKWVIDNNFPDSIQILCYNCNCAKGKFGRCPHQSI